MMDKEAIDYIIGAIEAGSTPKTYGADDTEGLPLAIVLRGADNAQRVECLKGIIDAYRYRPERMKGAATVQTIDSFNDLVNRHKNQGETVIFADTLSAAPGLTAVLNYNSVIQEPGWKDHRVNFKFPLSKEWKTWVSATAEGKRFTQPEFGAFLLFSMVHLAAPNDDELALAKDFNTTVATPAELLQLAKGLELHINATSKEEVNPRTGEKSIIFTEEQLNAKGEKLVVPGMFVIRIPMFQGDAASYTRVPVHLFFRRGGNGALSWWMALHMADDYLRAAVLHAVERVREATELPIYEGEPEK